MNQKLIDESQKILERAISKISSKEMRDRIRLVAKNSSSRSIPAVATDFPEPDPCEGCGRIMYAGYCCEMSKKRADNFYNRRRDA